MGWYTIEKPCTFIDADGAARRYRRPGRVVELSADTAAQLGDAVRPLPGGGKAAADGDDEGPKRRARGGRRGSGGEETSPKDTTPPAEPDADPTEQAPESGPGTTGPDA